MKQPKFEPACVAQQECLRISSTAAAAATVALVHEAGIELQINGNRLLKTQCMARDLEQMAVGFMTCEGLLQSRSELSEVRVDCGAGIVNVIADIPAERLQKAGAATRLASGGSKTGVIDFMQEQVAGGFTIASPKTIDAARVLRLGNEFNGFAGLYRDTKFVHSAALSDGQDILCHAEDVGRHNAVDKVVGFGFLHDMDFGQTVLLCSGRFSLEMVSKAARMQIPIYVSPAAPSVEAVQLAERLGMCLCGRVQQDSANIYSASWRIRATAV